MNRALDIVGGFLLGYALVVFAVTTLPGPIHADVAGVLIPTALVGATLLLFWRRHRVAS